MAGIFRMSQDPRSQIFDQMGQSIGQGVGQAMSSKTLKSMFQDVIDAGGSPLTAMQRIMPFDPDLADKLGDQESKRIGDKYLRDVIQRELGITVPDNVDTPTAVGALNISLSEQQRKAEAASATEQQRIANEKLALERRRVAVAERPDVQTPPRMRSGVEVIGDRKVLINLDTGDPIRDLGPAPVKAGSGGKDADMKNLFDEFQSNRSKMASIRAGENQWIPEEATKGEAIKMLEKRNNEIKTQYGKLGGDMGNLGEFTDVQVIKDLGDLFPPAENRGVVKRDTETGIEYISDGKEWKVRGL